MARQKKTTRKKTWVPKNISVLFNTIVSVAKGKIYTPTKGGNDITWEEVFRLKDFRDLYRILKQRRNYRLEFLTYPPTKTALLFMIFDKNLPKKSNSHAYKEYIDKCGEKRATSFTNIGNDCILTIPCKKYKNYATIKYFIDNATRQEYNDLWKEVCINIESEHKNLWLSTHGHGVAWTHIRLCRKPKYFICADGYSPTFPTTESLEYSIDKNSSELKKELMNALEKGDAQALKGLKKYGLDKAKIIELYGEESGTDIIVFASMQGFIDILRVLREVYGFDANDARENHNEALQLSVVEGNIDAVKELREGYGLDVEDARAKDNAALKYAASTGNIKMMEELRKFGLTREDARSEENKALRDAAFAGHPNAMRYLVDVYGLGNEDIRVEHDIIRRVAKGFGKHDIVDTFDELVEEAMAIPEDIYNNIIATIQQEAKEDMVKGIWRFRSEDPYTDNALKRIHAKGNFWEAFLRLNSYALENNLVEEDMLHNLIQDTWNERGRWVFEEDELGGAEGVFLDIAMKLMKTHDSFDSFWIEEIKTIPGGIVL